MRALCGAIIAAGAMIGLGMAAIGYGTRYQTFPYINPQTQQPQFVAFSHSDTVLMVIVVALIIGAIIGLATAFVGLAYHHHRRLHEMGLFRTGTTTENVTTGR